MKTLGAIIIFLFSNSIYAGNWISNEHLTKSRNREVGVTVYTRAEKCEAVSQEKCYEISGKDTRYHIVKQVREGSFEAATSISDCADPAACAASIADPVAKCGDESYQALWGDLDDNDDWQGVRDLESWCTRQALVDRLKEDAALKSQVQADDAAKAVEQASRETKRATRLSSLEDCAKSPGLSAPAQEACIIAMAKEMVRARLSESDL